MNAVVIVIATTGAILLVTDVLFRKPLKRFQKKVDAWYKDFKNS